MIPKWTNINVLILKPLIRCENGNLYTSLLTDIRNKGTLYFVTANSIFPVFNLVNKPAVHVHVCLLLDAVSILFSACADLHTLI